MDPSKVPFGVHATLQPHLDKVEDVRRLLIDARVFVDTESGTLQWFAYQLEDDSEGAPGGFGVFAACADATARNVHLNGRFPQLLAENAELFKVGPDVKPVDTLRFKTRDRGGLSPDFGARIFITSKPKTVQKIKRTLTSQYYEDVIAEPRTAFWYAFQQDETTFGLLAAFFSEEDRTAHLNGHGMWHMMDDVALSMSGVKSAKFPIVAFKA